MKKVKQFDGKFCYACYRNTLHTAHLTPAKKVIVTCHGKNCGHKSFGCYLKSEWV
jgi:hypothetical protein